MKLKPIEIFPYGFSLANGQARPVLIFKDKSGRHVLPVWVHPLDASMALHEQAQTPVEPHAVAQGLMKELGVRAERCEFTELSGHRQYAKVRFAVEPKSRREVRFRADQAMSFCLAARTRFYSTPEYMAKCRELDESFDRLAEASGQGAANQGTGTNGVEKGSKNPSYMM